MRAPFQVLVIPFKKEDNDFLYGVFLRKDLKIWQFIAGGGEDYDKSIYEAARREAYEEAGITENAKYIKLHLGQQYQL